MRHARRQLPCRHRRDNFKRRVSLLKRQCAVYNTVYSARQLYLLFSARRAHTFYIAYV
jgi:hypothetical protein